MIKHQTFTGVFYSSRAWLITGLILITLAGIRVEKIQDTHGSLNPGQYIKPGINTAGVSGDTEKKEEYDFGNVLDGKVPMKPVNQVNRKNAFKYAVATVSVANLRKTPIHSSELVTQVLMGTPLKIIKNEQDWFQVECPDHYSGWVDDGGIQLMTDEKYSKYVQSDKIIFTDLAGMMWKDVKMTIPVSDLVAGDILPIREVLNNYYNATVPDGRSGYVSRKSCMLLKDFIRVKEPAGDSLVKTALTMLGMPYLWGGTSVKGMDCSGFTKTVYWMNGIILPRDADEQALVGNTIDEARQFENLRAGDLLFFGRITGEGLDKRVVHVGMWIGKMRYIHASGRVKINSMDSLSAEFNRFNYERYIKSNRLAGSKDVIVLNELNLFGF